MPCDVSDMDLNRYFDGELPPAKQAKMAQHIASCADCTSALANLQELRASLRGELSPELPAGFADKVSSALRAEAPMVMARPRLVIGGWQQMAASFLLVGILASGGTYSYVKGKVADDGVTHDVVAAHNRAMLADSPIQVVSTDRHTVKPWFAGKADFSPDVKDFADQGFALQGGRLDYVGGRRVAAMVYRHDKHMIDLMMWPTASSDSAPQFSMSDGFHLASWVSGGLEARAISDMGPDEMKAFAELASAP